MYRNCRSILQYSGKKQLFEQKEYSRFYLGLIQIN